MSTMDTFEHFHRAGTAPTPHQAQFQDQGTRSGSAGEWDNDITLMGLDGTTPQSHVNHLEASASPNNRHLSGRGPAPPLAPQSQQDRLGHESRTQTPVRARGRAMQALRETAAECGHFHVIDQDTMSPTASQSQSQLRGSGASPVPPRSTGAAHRSVLDQVARAVRARAGGIGSTHVPTAGGSRRRGQGQGQGQGQEQESASDRMTVG